MPLLAVSAMGAPEVVRATHKHRQRAGASYRLAEWAAYGALAHNPRLHARVRGDAWKTVPEWAARIRAALDGTEVGAVEAAILKRARRAKTPEAADSLVTQEIERYLAKVTPRL